MEVTRETWHLLIRASVNNPEFFAIHVLRWKPRPWQTDLLRDIRAQLLAGKTLIQVLTRTCHGSGKTAVVAVLVLWFVVCHRDSRTLTTGPSWASVENLLWPEIRRIYERSLLSKVGFGRMLGTRFEAGPAWYAVGAASDKPTNLEGHHSPTAAMRIIDEAKAVEDGVYQSTAGMLDAPLNLDVWISTPSLELGKFYERDLANGRGLPPSAVFVRRIITIDDLITQGVKTPDQKVQMSLDWGGETSEVYQARAMAQYIQNAEGALIPARWITAAFERTWDLDTQPVMGYDVAGSVDGDQNALASYYGPAGDGRTFLRLEDAWHQGDTGLSVSKVNLWVRERRARLLRVDTAGLGKGPYDQLSKLGDSDEAYYVQAYRSADPVSDHRANDFSNRKAEDAFHMRRVFEEGKIALACDPRHRDAFAMQLKAMKYKVLQNGKWAIVDPKDSPDMFDASMMAMSQRGTHEWDKVGVGDTAVYHDDDMDADAGPGDASAWG